MVELQKSRLSFVNIKEKEKNNENKEVFLGREGGGTETFFCFPAQSVSPRCLIASEKQKLSSRLFPGELIK